MVRPLDQKRHKIPSTHFVLIPHSGGHQTETQAAAWLVRLEADLSPETLAQWRDWLSEDTRHHAVYVRIESGWRQAECLQALRPLDGTVDSRRPHHVSRLATVLAGATCQVPSERRACDLRGGSRDSHDGVGNMVSRFESGARRASDGAGRLRAHCAPGRQHRLAQHQHAKSRSTSTAGCARSSLTRGEALFTVAPEEGRPFTVSVAGTVVRALGTSFTVRQAESGGIEIIVSRGRVSVTPRASALHLLLTEGDDARIDATGTAAIGRLGTTDIDHRLAWTRGQIWFNEAALTEAIAEFNRYNNRKFVLADPQLATLRVGGSFAATDPNGVRRRPRARIRHPARYRRRMIRARPSSGSSDRPHCLVRPFADRRENVGDVLAHLRRGDLETTPVHDLGQRRLEQIRRELTVLAHRVLERGRIDTQPPCRLLHRWQRRPE